GNGCHFGDFLAADQSIPVVQAFISSEIDVRDALAGLEAIRLDPIQEIAPCRNFDRDVDLTVVHLHIHVIHLPFTARTSFFKNGFAPTASTPGRSTYVAFLATGGASFFEAARCRACASRFEAARCRACASRTALTPHSSFRMGFSAAC